MITEPRAVEDQLFLQLRVATAQRLRAVGRGDQGLCALLARQRSAHLTDLRTCAASQSPRILQAA